MTTSANVNFEVWVPALASGFMPLASFVAWADNLIVENPYQPKWVLDLSLARDADEAERILRIEWSRLSESPANGVPPLSYQVTLYLGFLYQAYEAGRLSIKELLDRAGRYTDAYGEVNDPCEAFYRLLNEIGGGGPFRKSDRPLPDRVRELFAPMAREARFALSDLPDGQQAVAR